MAKAEPMSVREACALLSDCVRKGCLGEGDARAVGVLIREAKRAEVLTAAADDCLSLLECCELEGSEGEDGRIDRLRQAL
jgi:hypothetical protein